MGRAVRFLAERGVRQFLDIGSGIPTMGNVHEIAQQAAPDVRVLYVGIDTVAVLHSRQLLAGNDQASAIEGDLRHARELLDQLHTPELAAIIDLDQPVGLILAAVLHFVPDDDEAYGAVSMLREHLWQGSWLVISHAAVEGYAAEDAAAATRAFERTTAAHAGLRRHDEIARFFDGLDLVDPGLVWLPDWRPAPVDPQDFSAAPHRSGLLAGVAQIR
ncbi:SAM-dependent methyltransferase [Phytohabitans rumicis]|uniref:S-adenosyl methyltransferase n=1 Tax=Phytohabitans rumicis TaxID=1076125 RepID=A0A6V8LC11_9ACTN|nr:hypothetical protein Prum_068120 [Phytohabitans rumicis]